MKVILNQDLANIGEEGDIANVARGYARNYLIPKGLVLPYTKDAVALIESRREAIEKRREEKRELASSVKSRLESETLVIQMPAGERGRLFGSVTSANIADALLAKGIEVERKRIDVPDKTIKVTGTSYVRIRLYGDEEAELRVDVSASGAKQSDESAVADEGVAADQDAAAPETEGAEQEEAATSPEGETEASPQAASEQTSEAEEASEGDTTP